MNPRLLVLTDRTQVPRGRSLLDQIAAVAAGGADHLLLREVDLDDGERAVLAAHARALGLQVVAAHRALPGCVGVQLPAGAASPSSGGRWGRSCHRRSEVLAAARAGAAWATLSPFAATPSKPGYGPPVPVDEWRDLPLPTYALGGVVAATVRAARSAGAYGVAVMGEPMRAHDPAVVVRALLDELALADAEDGGA